MDFKEGEILAFDKPYGITSFALVSRVRYQLCRHLGIKKLKVGHAGTLDPLATGVLIMCTGKATKQIEQLKLDNDYLRMARAINSSAAELSQSKAILTQLVRDVDKCIAQLTD